MRGSTVYSPCEDLCKRKIHPIEKKFPSMLCKYETVLMPGREGSNCLLNVNLNQFLNSLTMFVMNITIDEDLELCESMMTK